MNRIARVTVSGDGFLVVTNGYRTSIGTVDGVRAIPGLVARYFSGKFTMVELDEIAKLLLEPEASTKWRGGPAEACVAEYAEFCYMLGIDTKLRQTFAAIAR